MTEVLSPVLYISSMYGLNNTRRKTVFSYILRFIYSVLFIIGYTILPYIVYYNVGNGYDSLMGIELIIKILVSSLSGVTMIVSSFLHQRQFVNLISTLKIREEELITYIKKPCSRGVKIFMYSQFLLLFFLQGHNFFYIYFKYCKNEDKLMVSCIGGWLTFNLYPLLSFVHSIMFSTIILIIRRQFFIINNILLNIYLQSKGLKVKWMTKIDFNSDKLLSLKKIHSHLTRDSKQIIHIFSVTTLFKFLDGFLLVFCYIHFSITQYQISLKSYITESGMLSLNTALVPITELLSVIIICQRTSTESAHTAVVLHKLYGVYYKRQKCLVKIVSLLFSIEWFVGVLIELVFS